MTANVKKTWWKRNKGKVLTLSGYALAAGMAIAGKRMMDDLQDQITDLGERTDYNENNTVILFEEVVDLAEQQIAMRDELDVVNDALN